MRTKKVKQAKFNGQKLVSISKCLFLCLFIINFSSLQAQTNQCIFKDTLLKIDFGTVKNPQEFNLRLLPNYERDHSDCPNDGYYSYSTETSDCFAGDWITLTGDHTANDLGGKMMFVNASLRSSVFFITKLAGFKANTTYEFALWLMNLCKVNTPCTPLPPDIIITLETTAGKRLISFQTGLIVSNANPYWKKYSALFTTPADVDVIVLKMLDRTNGGCGNDFVMDDITFRECYKIEPVAPAIEIKPGPKQDIKPTVVIPKKTVKEAVPEKLVLKNDTLSITKLPVKDSIKLARQVTNIKPVNIPLPEVIVKRENPVIKKIETAPAEMLIELYDNGQIDGDTVSIYHNNELIVSHAGLSEKPVRFKIKVDAKAPHHELIMVADNLGSIPPNTSLMIITANGKRYEIFISSSEQKNAKLLIDLKE
ncbi:MAG: hypothetical protein ABI741_02885 [Ferruginibacter sp.]